MITANQSKDKEKNVQLVRGSVTSYKIHTLVNLFCKIATYFLKMFQFFLDVTIMSKNDGGFCQISVSFLKNMNFRTEKLRKLIVISKVYYKFKCDFKTIGVQL